MKAQKDGRCKCNLIPNFCNKGCEYNTSDEEYDEFETLAIKSLETIQRIDDVLNVEGMTEIDVLDEIMEAMSEFKYDCGVSE